MACHPVFFSCHPRPNLLCETSSPSNSNVVPLEGTLSFDTSSLALRLSNSLVVALERLVRFAGIN